MKFVYTSTAEEALSRLPRVDQKRIAKKMDFYAEQRDPLRFAKPLVGRGALYRFRIGPYRLIFEVTKGTLYALLIIRRDKAYKEF